MVDLRNMTLDVDLEHGVVPISKAASSLAALIKRSRANHQPIIVTQKGYPTGVILDVELFTALRDIAEAAEARDEPATLPGAPIAELPDPYPELATLEAEAVAEPAEKRRTRRG